MIISGKRERLTATVLVMLGIVCLMRVTSWMPNEYQLYTAAPVPIGIAVLVMIVFGRGWWRWAVLALALLVAFGMLFAGAYYAVSHGSP